MPSQLQSVTTHVNLPSWYDLTPHLTMSMHLFLSCSLVNSRQKQQPIHLSSIEVLSATHVFEDQAGQQPGLEWVLAIWGRTWLLWTGHNDEWALAAWPQTSSFLKSGLWSFFGLCFIGWLCVPFLCNGNTSSCHHQTQTLYQSRAQSSPSLYLALIHLLFSVGMNLVMISSSDVPSLRRMKCSLICRRRHCSTVASQSLPVWVHGWAHLG